MKKKHLGIVILAIMLCVVFTACAGNSTNPPPASNSSNNSSSGTTDNAAASPEHIKILLFGDESPRMKELMSDFNKTTEKEINVTFEIQYMPWSAYGPGQQIDLMIAAGQDFDATLTDSSWVASLVAKQGLADVTDVFNQEMGDYKQNINPDAFKPFSIGGKLYALPIGNKPMADTFQSLCVRQDLLKEAGMADLKTLDDVDKFVTACKAKHPEMYALGGADYQLQYFALRGMSNRNVMPFMGDYFLVDEDNGKLLASYDSEEFKTHVDLLNKWYKEDLISKDILTSTTANVDLFTSGQTMLFRGTSLTTKIENEPALKANIPTADTAEYQLNPTKPKFKNQFYNTAFMVPAYSKKAASVAKFVNLLQKNSEYVNLFTYGIEGTDYTLTDNKIDRKITDELFPQWMTFNIKISSFEKSYPDSFITAYKVWDDGAITSKAYGFSPDFTNVSSERAKIDSVWAEDAVPMLAGVVSYDSGIKKLTDDLKAAGWDTFQAEMEKQFEAFRATQN